MEQHGHGAQGGKSAHGGFPAYHLGHAAPEGRAVGPLGFSAAQTVRRLCAGEQDKVLEVVLQHYSFTSVNMRR